MEIAKKVTDESQLNTRFERDSPGDVELAAELVWISTSLSLSI